MDLKAKGKVLFSQLGERLLQQLPSSPWKIKAGFSWGRRSVGGLRGMLLLGCGYGQLAER